jgi:hypothetical protein
MGTDDYEEKIIFSIDIGKKTDMLIYQFPPYKFFTRRKCYGNDSFGCCGTWSQRQTYDQVGT